MDKSVTDAYTATTAARRHAIICVLSASAVFSLGAGIVKSLTAEIPLLEIVMFRSFVGFLAMLPILWRNGGLSALATPRPGGHVLRTVYGFIGTVTAVYGYATLPIATVTALGFAMPLFLTVLSVPMLGETVGWRRATAVLAGLAGVLVMLRPWQDSETGPMPVVPVLWVMLGVVTWALSMISIRRMGQAGERNVTIVAWYSIGTAVLATIGAVPNWVTPTAFQFAALLAAGLLSGVAQLLMTEGYRGGEATLVAPFEYGAIVYATVLGILFWAEWPDAWSLVGIAILIGAGLYIWYREVTLGIRR